MTLRLKLALVAVAGIVAAIALLLPLLSAFSALYLQGYNHVGLDAVHREAVDRLSGLDEVTPAAVKPALDEVALAHPGIELELLGEDGSVVYASSGRTRPYDAGEMMLRLTGQPYNLFTSRDATLLFDVPLDGGQYVLALSVAGELLQPVQIFAYFNEYSSVPFLLVPLLLVLWLPTLLVTIYAARLARRIRGLSTAVGSVDLETPAVIPADASRDEIGQLTRRFQAMSDALQEQFARVRRVQEARRTLVANLSHDLRTPLASILGYAETLQQDPGDGAAGVNRYATIIAQRARYMDRLLDHLFEASLLDRPDGALEMRPHNIGLLVEQVVVEYASLLEDRRIHLDLDLPARPVCRNVNDWSLQQVVRNLIDNALAYGGEGGYLGVRVAETAADVIIAVTDRGRGIPAGEEERIFEPFYRLEAGRRGGNVGFGLSLAREIVARHGGRIWVESKPYVSTVFTIALPKADAPPADPARDGAS